MRRIYVRCLFTYEKEKQKFTIKLNTHKWSLRFVWNCDMNEPTTTTTKLIVDMLASLDGWKPLRTERKKRYTVQINHVFLNVSCAVVT